MSVLRSFEGYFYSLKFAYPLKHLKASSQPYYVAAGINSSLPSRPSAPFPVISNRQQLFCSVGKAYDGNQSRKYNTDLPLVNSELEHGVDAITASGNGDSEVEKQTAKSAVWNLLGYNPILMESLWILHIAILVIEIFYDFYVDTFWRYRPVPHTVA